MNVLIFGATGMVGQGVLRECLLDPAVRSVVTVGRSATGRRDEKLHGMSGPEYTRITYDLTLEIAQALAAVNSGMTFVYVSGAGTDSTEKGRSMWARVKGRTENALRRLPFPAAYMFRPAAIVPMHGVRSKTRLYRAIYAVLTPVTPLLRSLFPNAFTTTEQLGRAMLAVAQNGYPSALLETRDINRL